MAEGMRSSAENGFTENGSGGSNGNRQLVWQAMSSKLVPAMEGSCMVTEDRVGYAIGSRTRSVFARIYVIDRAVASGQYPNAESLAQSLEVSKRTVERDLELLRDLLGAPIVYDRRRRGYYYSNDFTLPQIGLSAGEVTVLLIGQELLSGLAGTPWAYAARRVIQKLPLLLGDDVSIGMDSWAMDPAYVSFGFPRLRGDEETVSKYFATLLEAISSCTRVTLEYYAASRNEVSTRDVDPYHLRMEQGAWYLIGFCHKRQDLRIFAIDRIRGLTVTDQRFSRSSGFSVSDYLRNAWDLQKGKAYRVVIAFDREQARWIRERVWQDTQVLTDTPDGGMTLELEVTGLEAIQRWIMSFGGHARVLHPPELADSVRRQAQLMVDAYSRGSSHAV